MRKLRTSFAIGLAVGALGAGIAPSPAEAKLRLSPQMVVDQTLKQGRAAKAAELTAQRSYLQLEEARSVFDLELNGQLSWEHREAESLTGLSNPRDRTTIFGLELSKTVQTGTTFTVGYDRTKQASVLNPVTQQTRNPNANQHATGFGVRQNLLRNTFGFADRLAVEAAESRVQSALETREEELERVLLQAMTQFWDAYVAQRQLQENIAARDKYEQLVKNVRRKAGFNLSTPGELPRLEAEFEGAESRVKASATAYLNAVDRLLTTIQMTTSEDIEFDIPVDLPPVPQLAAKDTTQLRNIRIAETALMNADRDLRVTRNRALPQVDLVARATSTGTDPNADTATAEMVSGTKPTYFVGIEFSTALDSSLIRGQVADRRVAIEQSRNALDIARETARDQLRALERTVVSNYAIAKATTEAVEHRERVVRQLENSYRQGRQPLVELIRAYNELFVTQQEKARAVGDYHTSLNELAAARDELVTVKR